MAAEEETSALVMVPSATKVPVTEPVGRDRFPWTERVVGEMRVNVPEVKESEASERRNWEESRESRVSASELPPLLATGCWLLTISQVTSPSSSMSRIAEPAEHSPETLFW